MFRDGKGVPKIYNSTRKDYLYGNWASAAFLFALPQTV